MITLPEPRTIYGWTALLFFLSALAFFVGGGIMILDHPSTGALFLGLGGVETAVGAVFLATRPKRPAS
ncbi:MAG TPA: hypothetical protein VF234_05470 [Limnochordia bacterium]